MNLNLEKQIEITLTDRQQLLGFHLQQHHEQCFLNVLWVHRGHYHLHKANVHRDLAMPGLLLVR